jgi:hypothetical protein
MTAVLESVGSAYLTGGIDVVTAWSTAFAIISGPGALGSPAIR